uniref:Zinc finger protein 347-like n=1 Tax=Saccoglossus kowalevskii TaxID=10224 RepID=A0ABM0GYB2_SACKO|nr:PREDICTED: zinc finger protein 347-like [Saccoglossus kowalevskii]
MRSVSGSDDYSMRWMRFISTARHRHEQNVEATRREDGRIFFRTVRTILKGEELLVWYSVELGKNMGIPCLSKENIQGDQRYVCNHCWKVFRHPNTLKSHLHFKCSKRETRTNQRSPRASESSPFVSTAAQSRLNSMGTASENHGSKKEDTLITRRHGSPQITPHFNTLFSSNVASAFKPHTSSSTPKDNNRTDSDRAIIRKIDHHPVTITTPIVTSCASLPGHPHLSNGLHGTGEMRKLFSTTPAFPLEKSLSYPGMGTLIPYHHMQSQHKPFEKSCCPIYSQTPHLHTNLSLAAAGGLDRSVEHAHYSDYHHAYHLYPQTYEMHTQSLRTYNSMLPGMHHGGNDYISNSSHFLPYKLPYPNVMKYPEPFSFTAPTEEFSPFKLPNIDREIAMHTQPIHLNEPPTLQQSLGGKKKGHLCIYCGKLYSRKYGLKIHLRTHTGYKPLKCKVCLRPFGDPSNLNKHIRLHAEGDTPYRCEYCGKVLVRRRDLDRHVKSRHPNEASKRTENDSMNKNDIEVVDDPSHESVISNDSSSGSEDQ